MTLKARTTNRIEILPVMVLFISVLPPNINHPVKVLDLSADRQAVVTAQAPAEAHGVYQMGDV
jgi:hypothetical protein